MTVSALAILAYVSTTCSFGTTKIGKTYSSSKSAANAAECFSLASRMYGMKKRVMQTHAQLDDVGSYHAVRVNFY